jgi:hypothetical protein
MMRTLTPADLQAVLAFFGRQAATHFRAHQTVPPACVLVWMHPDRPEVNKLHQFPVELVVDLLASDTGKHQLAQAIQAIVNPALEDAGRPACPRPDLVVQVLLARPEGLNASESSEALMLLVYTTASTYAVAIPVNDVDGAMQLPEQFDLEEARL